MNDHGHSRRPVIAIPDWLGWSACHCWVVANGGYIYWYVYICYSCFVYQEFCVTFIVTDACVKCKLMDCVEICPVDCFYEGENFLVIDPEDCIDCGICEPECPLEAIKPDTEDTPDQFWLKVNTKYSEIWPNITRKGIPPADGDQYRNEKNKFDRFFSENPGNTD